jgi:hypothetical protein
MQLRNIPINVGCSFKKDSTLFNLALSASTGENKTGCCRSGIAFLKKHVII